MIKDVDSEWNAELVASILIREVHNANSPLREYLRKLEICSDAFADIIELGLDAVKTRELLFRRLRNHSIMISEEEK